METVRFNGGFATIYSTGVIKESVAFYGSNIVCFSFFSGHKIQTTLPALAEVNFYNSQFGISVTKDGKYFFIQSWEKNTVFCFRITDCKKIWTARIRHPHGLCVREEFLMCYSMHDGVYKIALDSGIVVTHFPCTYTSCFHFIDNTMFFIGPLKNEYRLIDFDFRQLATVPVDIANPTHYDTFLINEVTVADKLLTLTGFEYNSTNLHSLSNELINQKIEDSRFYREIDLSPFICGKK